MKDDGPGQTASSWRRWGKRLGPVFSLGIFALALLLLHHLLGRFQLSDIAAELHRIPTNAVESSLLLTAASYLALGGFDGLAVTYLGKPLPPFRILLISFVSHAVSASTGFATLTGGAIRYRMYSALGLAAAEVAAVVAFCGLTYGLGASSLAATALLSEPGLLSSLLHLPAALLRGLGVLLGLAVAGYVAWGALARRPLILLRRRWDVPGPSLAIRQIAVAATDLALAAAALHVLLPADARPAYPAFVGAYVVANLLGLLAHVPGGLGVFDAAILVLTPDAPPEAVLGALLLFRGFYNLLPLALAAVILLLYELLERLPGVGRRVAGTLGDLGPPLLATLVFAVGGLTVVAHAVPETWHVVMSPWQRLVGMAEAAIGCAMMALGQGLNRRIRSVRLVVCGLLAALAALVLIQDPFAPRAVALGLLTVILALSGEWVDPDAHLAPLTPPWLVAVGAFLAAAGWVTWVGAHAGGLATAALRPALLADGAALGVYAVVVALALRRAMVRV